jgi:glyoxylase-like metal-dependent hydrolase (beta-lactamase superfamily II)
LEVKKMAFQGGLTPGKYPVKEINEKRVMEIAPDIWMLEGYVSDNFFKKPPSSNCFIMRDKDMVLLIDTGTYPHYRERILKILERYRKDGAKKLVLMLTQGHFDHICNNDIILEAGYGDVRFLVPEVELSTLDIYSHWTGEYREVQEYYNPFHEMHQVVPRIASRISMDFTQRMVDAMIARLFRGVNTMIDAAEPLSSASRVRRKFGDVEFLGWEIGRFFAIHDATHSPGHLSFYDPEHRVFITGDATLEINPPFFNSSLNNCITMMGAFKKFAQLGYVKVATDSHRSVTNASRLVEAAKRDPLHRLQIVDTVHGDDCIEFYSFFEKYYGALKNEVLTILKRRKEATVHQIIQDLRSSEDPNVQFKVFINLPKLPSRLEIYVANVLKEENISKRKEGDAILFSY